MFSDMNQDEDLQCCVGSDDEDVELSVKRKYTRHRRGSPRAHNTRGRLKRIEEQMEREKLLTYQLIFGDDNLHKSIMSKMFVEEPVLIWDMTNLYGDPFLDAACEFADEQGSLISDDDSESHEVSSSLDHVMDESSLEDSVNSHKGCIKSDNELPDWKAHMQSVPQVRRQNMKRKGSKVPDDKEDSHTESARRKKIKRRVYTVSKGIGHLSSGRYKPHIKIMLDEAMLDKLSNPHDWLIQYAPPGQKYTSKQVDLMDRTGLSAVQIRHYMHNNARKAKRMFQILQDNGYQPVQPKSGRKTG
jgi:hypothetical protein